MTITSGIGLVSGINTGQLIDSLMAIDQQPVTNLQNQNKTLQSKEAAYQAINAALLALKTSTSSFSDPTDFQATTATSSDESVLSATTDASATPGTYTFLVHQLVSSQQMITSGFRDANSTPVGAGTLTFDRIQSRLDSDTNLDTINGGEGFARGKIRITDRSGASAVVDLTTATNINDVITQINNTQGINVVASVDGDHLVLTDRTGQTGSSLQVTDAGSAATAESLGLTATASGGVLTGAQINKIGDDTLLASLNNNLGVRTTSGGADIAITDAAGDSFNVDLSSAVTVGDVIQQINTATAGKVNAAIGPNGTGLTLTDTTGGGPGFAVTDVGGSNAAEDLGILGTDTGGTGVLGGKRLIAGMNSTLLSGLNGGTGVSLGDINITNSTGTVTNVNLAAASSVNDVLDAINNAGAGVTASLNNAGDGIQITDNAGGTGDMIIADGSTGTAATDLHIAGDFTSKSVNSGGLDLQYVNSATTLDSLGVAKGKFKITDSAGTSAEINLTADNMNTIGDVINQINSSGLAVQASINAKGDGILLKNTGPGTTAMTVQEDGSTTASDLGLLQTAATPAGDIDGSFKKTVDITATDTLQDVADKINAANVNVSANIINDGSGADPYRLSLTSDQGGTLGAFVFDSGSLDFGTTTLAEAHDAQVFFGSADPSKAIILNSKTNTLTNVIPGVTVNLHAASDQPVQLSIAQDHSDVESGIQNFVDGFNTLVQSLDKQDSYDSSTQTAGLLLGSGTVSQVRQSMYSAVINPDNDLTGQYKSLSQIGITVGMNAQLQFDKSKFEQAMQTDPEAVQQLFTYKQTQTDPDTGDITTIAGGVGVKISDLLDHLTDPTNGVIENQVNALSSQVDLNNDRITTLNAILAAKRANLQEQFNQMELSLQQIQNQGKSLASLTGFTALTSGSSNSSSSGSSSSSS